MFIVCFFQLEGPTIFDNIPSRLLRYFENVKKLVVKAAVKSVNYGIIKPTQALAEQYKHSPRYWTRLWGHQGQNTEIQAGQAYEDQHNLLDVSSTFELHSKCLQSLASNDQLLQRVLGQILRNQDEIKLHQTYQNGAAPSLDTLRKKMDTFRSDAAWTRQDLDGAQMQITKLEEKQHATDEVVKDLKTRLEFRDGIIASMSTALATPGRQQNRRGVQRGRGARF
ncbi:MAG: hypothetical protein Q9159_005637 [Coniocarpon cinnabarinum]